MTQAKGSGKEIDSATNPLADEFWVEAGRTAGNTDGIGGNDGDQGSGKKETTRQRLETTVIQETVSITHPSMAVMLLDMVGAGSIIARDPEAFFHGMGHILESAMYIITLYQGEIITFTGDGMLVAFRAQTSESIDETTWRAMCCAAKIQQFIDQQQQITNSDWQFRIGIGNSDDEGELDQYAFIDHHDEHTISLGNHGLQAVLEAEKTAQAGIISLSPAAQLAHPDYLANTESPLTERSITDITDHPRFIDGHDFSQISTPHPEAKDRNIQRRQVSIAFIEIADSPLDLSQTNQLLLEVAKPSIERRGGLLKVALGSNGTLRVMAMYGLEQGPNPEASVTVTWEIASFLETHYGISVRAGIATEKAIVGNWGAMRETVGTASVEAARQAAFTTTSQFAEVLATQTTKKSETEHIPGLIVVDRITAQALLANNSASLVAIAHPQIEQKLWQQEVVYLVESRKPVALSPEILTGQEDALFETQQSLRTAIDQNSGTLLYALGPLGSGYNQIPTVAINQHLETTDHTEEVVTYPCSLASWVRRQPLSGCRQAFAQDQEILDIIDTFSPETTLSAIAETIIERLSTRNTPYVLLIDNAHNLDQESLTLLLALAEQQQTAIVVILMQEVKNGQSNEVGIQKGSIPQISTLLADHFPIKESHHQRLRTTIEKYQTHIPFPLLKHIVECSIERLHDQPFGFEQWLPVFETRLQEALEKTSIIQTHYVEHQHLVTIIILFFEHHGRQLLESEQQAITNLITNLEHFIPQQLLITILRSSFINHPITSFDFTSWISDFESLMISSQSIESFNQGRYDNLSHAERTIIHVMSVLSFGRPDPVSLQETRELLAIGSPDETPSEQDITNLVQTGHIRIAQTDQGILTFTLQTYVYTARLPRHQKIHLLEQQREYFATKDNNQQNDPEQDALISYADVARIAETSMELHSLKKAATTQEMHAINPEEELHQTVESLIAAYQVALRIGEFRQAAHHLQQIQALWQEIEEYLGGENRIHQTLQQVGLISLQRIYFLRSQFLYLGAEYQTAVESIQSAVAIVRHSLDDKTLTLIDSAPLTQQSHPDAPPTPNKPIAEQPASQDQQTLITAIDALSDEEILRLVSLLETYNAQNIVSHRNQTSRKEALRMVKQLLFVLEIRKKAVVSPETHEEIAVPPVIVTIKCSVNILGYSTRPAVQLIPWYSRATQALSNYKKSPDFNPAVVATAYNNCANFLLRLEKETADSDHQAVTLDEIQQMIETALTMLPEEGFEHVIAMLRNNQARVLMRLNRKQESETTLMTALRTIATTGRHQDAQEIIADAITDEIPPFDNIQLNTDHELFTDPFLAQCLATVLER